MNKILLTLLIAAAGVQALAQDSTPATKDTKKKHKTERTGKSPGIYITAGTGLNNNTGILGFSFDVPVSDKVSIDGGPGIGTWGSKVYAGTKYYLKPNHRGFALGAGLTYCTGVLRDNANLNTIYGTTQNIEYNKNPLTSILFAVYKYWNLGRQYNRIYLELGWTTIVTGGDKITQLNGEPMTSDARSSLDALDQEGPIVAVGFSFGVR